MAGVECAAADPQRTKRDHRPHNDSGSGTGVVSGPDTYGATAVIAVESARQLADQDTKPGVLAPAQAFDPVGFLDFLTRCQASWSIEAWPAVNGQVLSQVN